MTSGLVTMHGMVTAQVAFSLLLVVVAGLFLRSFTTLVTRDLGVSPGPVLVATIDGQRIADRDARLEAYERIRQRVSANGSTSDAATSFLTPLAAGGFTPAIEVGTGANAVRVPAEGDVFGNVVSPRWFAALGTPLLAGRDFTADDRRGSAGVAVVNETFVRRYLAAGTPLGQVITIYPGSPRAQSMQIVGIARDAIYSSPREPVPPTWYAPLTQAPPLGFITARLTVRVRQGPLSAVSRQVAAITASVDPRLTVTFRPLADQLRVATARDRLLAQLAGFFGALALLLSGLGLYGVTAYAVSLRRNEFGIRTALGAAPWHIARTAVASVLRITVAGTAVGLTATWWSSRLIESLLFGISAHDPATIALSAAGVALLAMAAAWVPARRAAMADPASVLR